MREKLQAIGLVFIGAIALFGIPGLIAWGVADAFERAEREACDAMPETRARSLEHCARFEYAESLRDE